MLVRKPARQVWFILLAAALALASCNIGATPAPAIDVNAISTAPFDLAVQVRYRHPVSPVAALDVDGDRARLRFAMPERAVAPGQAAVLYLGDTVVGGGRIVATFS